MLHKEHEEYAAMKRPPFLVGKPLKQEAIDELDALVQSMRTRVELSVVARYHNYPALATKNLAKQVLYYMR
jgi:hypothetical protein